MYSDYDLVHELLKKMTEEEEQNKILRKYLKDEPLTKEEEKISFNLDSIENAIKMFEKMKEKEIQRQAKKIEDKMKEKKIPEYMHSMYIEGYTKGYTTAAKDSLINFIEYGKYQRKRELEQIIKNENDMKKLDLWFNHVTNLHGECKGFENKIYKYRNKKLTACEKETILEKYLENVRKDELLSKLTFMKK